MTNEETGVATCTSSSAAAYSEYSIFFITHWFQKIRKIEELFQFQSQERLDEVNIVDPTRLFSELYANFTK